MSDKRRRAKKGRGSIIEYGDRYAGIVELPHDPLTGKRRRKWIYGDTEKEVALAMDDARAADARKQRSGDNGERFASFLDRWLADTVRPNMRPSTVASYEGMVTRYVVPELGALRLREVTSPALQAFYGRLRDRGLGARTVQKAHAVLHRALASAERSGLLDHNPARLEADVPRYRAPEREPLTREQAKTLLQAARSDRLEALYVLALTTGAREGELFALRWSDVDLTSGMLSIRRSLQDAHGKGKLVAGPTKTKASRRRFELPAIAIAAPRAHRKRLEAEGLGASERDLVFPAANGGPLRRQNFLRRDFYQLLDRIAKCTRCSHSADEHRHRVKRSEALAACNARGRCKKWTPDFPRIHFQDLRHTAATQLAAAGAPVVQFAQLLGHVDPTVALRTYQHAFESAAGDAANQLGGLSDLASRGDKGKKK